MSFVRIPSKTRHGIFYRVDTSTGACNCYGFSTTGHCSHVDQIGVYKNKNWNRTKKPTFSQALSGLVKSIRIRHLKDSFYWLYYLDKFTEPGSRFRIARRILIASSEDGLSTEVMTSVSDQFSDLCNPKKTDILDMFRLINLVCKYQNWWFASTNGPEYIRNFFVHERRAVLYRELMDVDVDLVLNGLVSGIEEKDLDKALNNLSAVIYRGLNFELVYDRLSHITLPEKSECLLHLVTRHFKSLSKDTNFLSMIAWNAVTEGFKLIETGLHIDPEKDLALVEEAWSNPIYIPNWCCDGIHCSGTDRRFAGMLIDMDAVCEAYKFYGRVNPKDTWHRSFYTLEGLDQE